jgi:hypothetical protein
VITDSSGGFTSNFNAPATDGSYTLRILVSNRTISGSQDRYLAVSSNPTPDLAIVAGSLVIDPNSTTAGQTVTISVSVENRGTAAAGAFLVRINITTASGSGLSRDLAVGGLTVGERKDLSTRWITAEGTWTVVAIVDPTHEVSELSEENNRAGKSITVAPGLSNATSATLMVGLVMVGVGVAAIVAFAYRWRAGRRKGP